LINDGALHWLTIHQCNASPKKYVADMHNILKSILKDSKHSSCCEKWLWQQIKKWNAVILQLSKEEKIEPKRQM
jgi:hypothetical protein